MNTSKVWGEPSPPKAGSSSERYWRVTSRPVSFTSTCQLAGGAYLTGYRQYNPTYARFTQPDPIGQ